MQTEPTLTPDEVVVEETQDEAIARIVARLERPHPSGGTVIERAAILASGVDGSAVLRWVVEHGGEPEALKPVDSSRGLFAGRGGADTRQPLRYVLPSR